MPRLSRSYDLITHLPSVTAPCQVWPLLARCGRCLPGVAAPCRPRSGTEAPVAHLNETAARSVICNTQGKVLPAGRGQTESKIFLVGTKAEINLPKVLPYVAKSMAFQVHAGNQHHSWPPAPCSLLSDKFAPEAMHCVSPHTLRNILSFKHAISLTLGRYRPAGLFYKLVLSAPAAVEPGTPCSIAGPPALLPWRRLPCQRCNSAALMYVATSALELRCFDVL
eukprot:358524-Chlamydomonas_euryale.AAC.2